MIRRHFLKVLVIVGLITLMGIGSSALAYRDGWRGCRGGGPGWSGGWGDDISNKNFDKLQEERTDFFKDTSGLRQDIYAKDLELRSELEKQDPDVAKATELQKDLSALYAQLDQKKVEHYLKVRELTPYPGRGMRYGPMEDDGYYGRGPGYCWR
jgi:hypothetical protein